MNASVIINRSREISRLWIEINWIIVNTSARVLGLVIGCWSYRHEKNPKGTFIWIIEDYLENNRRRISNYWYMSTGGKNISSFSLMMFWFISWRHEQLVFVEFWSLGCENNSTSARRFSCWVNKSREERENVPCHEEWSFQSPLIIQLDL